MVISGGTSSGRGLGVDRFYNPPAVRRQLEQQRQQQQQEAALQRPVKAKPKPNTPPFMEAPTIDRPVENRAQSDDSSKPSLSSSSSSSLASHSPSPSPPPRSMSPVANLDRFLESTTPMVTPQYFHVTNDKGWRKYDGVELRPYFSLGDLWESFEEWSAYGCGVPLVLNGGDCVVQYYVPYLSAIQLYTNASRTILRGRQLGEESDAGIYQDTSSDVSSESEAERAFRKRRDSSTTICHKDQHGLSEENGVCKQTMLPAFEYLEHNPPYGREPLVDKISLLANKFPQLMTYRSCDLLPSSWISVAWYPIYRIPTGPTLRDLDPCFLTFHTLSTPLKYSCNGHSELNDSCRVREANDFTQMPAKLSLPVFGLASYKLKGSIWTNKNLYEQQLASSLLQAAEEWLQFHKVDHPDFRFFLSHYNTS